MDKSPTDRHDEHPSIGVLPAMGGAAMFGLAGMLLTTGVPVLVGVAFTLIGGGLYLIVLAAIRRAAQVARLADQSETSSPSP